MKKDLTPGTIYAAAVAALPACDIDHHASDLYIKRTPAATFNPDIEIKVVRVIR